MLLFTKNCLYYSYLFSRERNLLNRYTLFGSVVPETGMFQTSALLYDRADGRRGHLTLEVPNGIVSRVSRRLKLVALGKAPRTIETDGTP